MAERNAIRPWRAGNIGATSTVGIEGLSHLAFGRVIEFTRSMYRGYAYTFFAELSLSGRIQSGT